MDFFLNKTKTHLDLPFILDKIKVHTPYGREMKKKMGVYRLKELKALNAHYDLLESLVEKVTQRPVLFKKIRQVFGHFKTLDLTLNRLKDKETLSITEVFELKSFVWHVHEILELLKDQETYGIEAMGAVFNILDPENLKMPSFYLYDAYSEALCHIRREIKVIERGITLEKQKQKKAVEEKYKIQIRSNLEFTVAKHETELCELLEEESRLNYISETWMHKTYKLRSDEGILAKEESLEFLKKQAMDEECEVLRALSHELSKHHIFFKGNMLAIGHLDLLLGQVYFIKAYHLSRPEISPVDRIFIKKGIHLKTEDVLKEEEKSFVPISLDLKPGVTCITGANMGGKTIGLKLVGQMVAMAQYGLFVPCEHFTFRPFNFAFIACEDGQTIDQGLSTFGAEMLEISKVLKEADKGGLILIDELARGTNPKEGFALSKAIINYLKDKSSLTLLTTHLDGLADDEAILHLQVKGLKKVNFEDLAIDWQKSLHQWMDYELIEVKTPQAVPKDALKIARMMGLETSILEDARRIVEDKEAK
jgi:DNA mismatch repair ATPase MutS